MEWSDPRTIAAIIGLVSTFGGGWLIVRQKKVEAQPAMHDSATTGFVALTENQYKEIVRRDDRIDKLETRVGESETIIRTQGQQLADHEDKWRRVKYWKTYSDDPWHKAVTDELTRLDPEAATKFPPVDPWPI